MTTTDADRLVAVRNLLNYGTRDPSELLDRIARAIGPRGYALTTGPDPTRDNPVHCALCINIKGTKVPAVAIVEGYSLCGDCEPDVISGAPYIRLDSQNRFAFMATIQAHRAQRNTNAV